MAERRAFAQKISRYAAGSPAGPRGWEGGCGAAHGPCRAVRGLQPAPRQARKACGSSAVLCVRSRVLPGAPRPRPGSGRPNKRNWRGGHGAHARTRLTAPRAPRPPQRLRTHACTRTPRPQCKVVGCGTWEHPTYPWARWALIPWPQRKMDDPTHTGLYAWAWRSHPRNEPLTKDKVSQQFTSQSR